MSIFPVSQTLQAALQSVQGWLQQFASDLDGFSKLQSVFGSSVDGDVAIELLTAWQTGDFSVIPSIRLLTADSLNGANGAYGNETGEIYLAVEFVTGNVNRVEAIATTLLEEIGHHLDQILNTEDTPGDEGAAFSAVVRGVNLSSEQLAMLKQEDDSGEVIVDGQVVSVEQQDFVGDNGNNTIIGTSEDDFIQGLGGRDLLYGREANDLLEGGSGNDNLYGEAGDDTLDGGEGDDYLAPGTGSDTVLGGAGAQDWLDIDNRNDTADTTVIYTNVTNGSISGGSNDGTTFQDVERIRLRTGSGNDTIDISAVAGNTWAGEVYAGAGNDVVTTGNTRDLVYGEAGDDTIVGGEGLDLLYGGTDNDTLQGDAGNDSLYGQAGNDTLDGGEGDDYLAPGTGSDTVLGGEGSQDLLDIDNRNDTADITVTYTDVTNGSISGGSNDGTTFQDVERIRLRTGFGNDTIDISAVAGNTWAGEVYAGAGNDVVTTGNTRDLVYGEAGDDTIVGGEGLDLLYGGTDNDTLQGDAGNDSLYGQAGNDTLDGGEGDDYLAPGTGSDTVLGGEGSQDLLDIDNRNDTADITVTYTDVTNGSISGGSNDGTTFQDVERIRLRTGFGNDSIDISAVVGNTWAGEVYAGAGNDVVTTGNTRDLVYGEAGDDTIVGGEGNDQLWGGEDNDTLQGDTGNDNLYGQEGNDTLDGGEGDDYLAPGIGSDTVLGGAGAQDYLDIDNRNDTADTTVTYTDVTNGSISGGSNDGTTFQDIERIRLRTGSGNDSIDISAVVGNTWAGEVYAGAGNDVVTTGNTRDLVYGEAGDDTIVGGEGNDQLWGGTDNDTLQGDTGNDNLYGQEGNDTLDGGEGNDYLAPGTGSDTVLGGEGAQDYLDIDNRNDTTDTTVTYTDVTNGSISGGSNDGTTFQDIERIRLRTGSGNDSIDISAVAGNTWAGEVYAGAGNDVVTMGNTRDLVYGEAGDDTIVGGEGIDQLYGGTDNDTLQGDAGNDNLYGQEGNDTLDGGEGDDYLAPGTGSDTVLGGAGAQDWLDIDNRNDTADTTVTYTDVTNGSISGGSNDGTTFQDVERIRLRTGSGNDSIDISAVSGITWAGEVYAGAGNDVVTTGNTRDLVYGEAGDDTIVGGEGNDNLYGGTGNDLLEGVDANSSTPGSGEQDYLHGGAGSDRFILGDATWIGYDDRNISSSGLGDYATIADFNPLEDTIQLQGASTNYRLEELSGSTRLYIDKPGDEPDELIAILQNVTGLDPNSSAFDYVASINELVFSSEAYTVNEDGTATITVLRNGDSAGEVSATLALSNGTAIASGDYDNTPITVTFADGQITQTVTVPIVDDDQFEADETINLTLTGPTGGVSIGDRNAATLTIIDNDAPQPGTLAFNRSTYSINENGTPIIAVTVSRTGGSDGEVSATISLADGTATGGEDYNGEDIVVTLADGETNQTVEIPILDDNVYEESETINLTLSSPTGGADLGTRTIATLTIADDDAQPGTFAFSAANYQVNEDGIPVTAVTIDRVDGTDGPVNVTVSLTDGTATFPDDYSNSSVVVAFASGETSKTVTLPIVDDGVFEPDETLNLTLVSATAGATIGTQDTATLTILDNDDAPGTLAFESANFAVNEDGTSVAEVAVVRTGGSNGEVSVTVDLADGTASAPDDYDGTSVTVTFASGELRKTVEIPIIDDSIFEETETINLSLSSPTNGALLGTQTAAVLSVLDNDAQPGTLNFSQTNYTINEDGTADVAVTLLRTDGNDGAISATVVLSDGTAAGGDDYVTTPVTVNFADGETSKTVIIPIIDDAVLESTETLNLTLTNAAGGAILGNQIESVLSIIDDDFSPSLTLSLAAPSIAEDGGTVTGTITRNTPTTEPLTVTVRSSDTTELTVPETVTIAAGESSADFTLTVVDDTLLDTNQSVTVIATAPGFSSSSEEITVINDDVLNLSLTLAQSSISEGGDNTSVIATVTRDLVTPEALVIQLSSSDPDAVNLPSEITIPAGAASATFTVNAIDNAVLTGNQTVTITATPTDVETNIPLDTGVATVALEVLDNESAGLSLSLDRDLIAETGTATATITRNGDLADAVTVDLASSDTGEATVPNSVVIGAGESSTTFTVSGVGDAVSDGSQSVTITASATGLNPDVAVVEVTDIEVPDLVITELAANSPAYTDQQEQFTYKVENLGLQNVSDTWTDRVYLSTDNQLDDSDLLLTEFEITADIQVGQFYERSVSYFNPRTPGEYYLIATTDADGVVNEGIGQGEINNTVIAPFTVIPAYSAEVSTDVELGVAGQSIVLQGSARSNADNTPIPFEFVTIEVENNGFTRELSGFTDANGNFVRAFTPLVNEGGDYNIRAYFPDNVDEDTGFEDSFKVLGATFETEQARHNIVADTPFTASVNLDNLTDTALTGFTYSVDSLPDNWDVQVSLPDTLAGDGTNTIDYTITAPNESLITQDTFNINLTSAEGVTATLPVTANLERIIPRLVADTNTVTSGMLRGEQTFVDVELTNEGGATANDIQVLLPDAPWLSLATTDTIESLAPGESTNVTLALTPDSNLDLTEYQGNIVFDAEGNDGDLSLGFNFRAVSDATGDLAVNVIDELFYFAEGSPKLGDASVVLRDYFTGAEVARVTTDDTGMVNFEGLAEGYYTLEVKAEDHDTFRQTVQIDAGETETINSFLSRQTVKYTWTVTETEIQDQYNITVESVFETDVPIPTVTVDPPSLDFADLQVVGQVMQIDMTLANHGLIAAEDVGLSFGNHPFYKIEALIESVETLDAKSSITVPVRITRVADFDTLNVNSGEFNVSADEPLIPCGIAAAVEYCYECGDELICKKGTLYIGNVEGNCPDLGPSIFEERSDGIISNSGPRIRKDPVTVQATPSNCDPCDLQNALGVACLLLALPGCFPVAAGAKASAQALSCLIGLADGNVSIGDGANYIPKPCIYDLLLCICNFCLPDDIPFGDSLKTICDFINEPRFEASSASPRLDINDLNLDLSIESNSILVKFIDHANAIRSYLDAATIYFGDSIWVSLEGEDNQKLQQWLDVFASKTEGVNTTEVKISDDERAELLALELPFPITPNDAGRFIDRWNRSVDYWQSGIRNLADVPEGQSNDFIAIDKFQEASQLWIDTNAQAEASGYNSLIDAIEADALEFQETLESESLGICAKVRIAIDQEAVMTRSAFLGELVIENTSDTISLEDISVNLEVRDENGNLVNELFGITDPILENLNAVDGSGLLGTNSIGSAEWTFIPSTNTTTSEEPVQYSIGGTLSYEQDGQLVTVPLLSTPVTVYPQAELYLDYFQQRNVYGDDPFTDAEEISEPFSLGVLVQNRGFGAAKDLSITSAQPEIIENEKGLLIDFDIIGSQVNNEAVTPSLAVDFGTIGAGETAVADWLFKSSLQGKFIDYEATFEHVNDLGVEELSLIKEVNIHELIRKVQVEHPTDDNLPDFLVNDEFDPNFDPDTLYFSDGTTAAVTAITDATVDAPVTFSDLDAEITVTATSGWSYIRLLDPADGQFAIDKILRSDGTEISAANFWRTDRTFPATGRPIYEDVLHFLDKDSTGSYTVIYDSDDNAPPQVQEIVDVAPDPRNSPVDTLQVVFTEAILANTFDYQDLTLTLDGGNNLITSDVTLNQIDANTFEVQNLTGLTGNIGQYQFSIDATGVQDLSGNDGAGTVNETWLFTGDRPAVATINGFTSNLLTAPVDSFEVTFTEAILPDSFDYTDISLTRNEGGNLLNDTVTITQLNDTTFQVANLGGFTDIEGDYELLVAANGVQDTDNNNGVGGKGFAWVLDNTAPVLTNIEDIDDRPRNTPISSLEISFDQAIDPDSFDYSDLSLTLNGGPNLITDAVTIEKRNETTYTIQGLTALQTGEGNYLLTVDGSGIQDTAGNAVNNNLTTDWTLDTIEPLAAVNLQVSAAPVVSQLSTTSAALAILNEYGQYRVNSTNITLTGDLPESDLQVYIKDATTGESLGQATVTDTQFSAEVELSGAGSRTLEIDIVDLAGNRTTGTVDIFADLTKPTILEVLNLPGTDNTEPVNYLDVVFSEILDLSTFDYTDLALVRDGGSNLITDTVTIEYRGGTTYRINGLTNLTNDPGVYRLSIDTTQLTDRAGNTGFETEQVTFSLAAPPEPGFTLLQSGSGTVVTEGGPADSYTIVLDTQPVDEVRISLSVEDGITVDQAVLVFDETNWSIPQSVQISAINDTLPEVAQISTISHTVTSDGDPDYGSGTLSLPDVSVTINDDDVEIAGTVWNDANGDGVRTVDEAGLDNWTVYLDDNLNGQLDQDEISTQTDTEGNYRFTDLRPGSYTVAQEVREGWQQTLPVVTTTASSVELHTPSEPEVTTASSSTTTSGELINLDDLRNDSRFADINGSGFSSVVIDTGIDVDHSFFGPDADGDGVADRIVYQYDFADNDSDASDKNGHGSHVASILGSGDSTYGGVAPEVDLIALKVFKDNGSGQFADLEESLQWVINNAEDYNIASVNLSLGDEQNWTTDGGRYGIGDELDALANMGIIVTAAAGNNFSRFGSTQGLAYPAVDANTVSVGAVNGNTDQIADFSQREATLLDVFAPGTAVTGANSNGGTMVLSGTSQATPHIAGIAVLAQQIAIENLGRQLTVDEFNSLLATTSVIINDGDDEVDAVTNTGLDFPRVDMLSMAEAILALDTAETGGETTTAEENGTDDPLYLPADPAATPYTVSLAAGDVATDIDFGNQLQQLPNLLGVNFDALEDHLPLGQTSISFTIANQGTDVSTAFDVDIVYSDDEVIGNDDDLVVDTLSFDGLGIGEEITYEGDIQLPRDILNSRAQVDDPTGMGGDYVSGSYDYIGIVIDPDGLIAETNTSDNFNQGKGFDNDDVTYFPWDIDGNGVITPTDAIFVINRLGQSTPPADNRADFDGNGLITPTDAISAINRLGYSLNSDVFNDVSIS